MKIICLVKFTPDIDQFKYDYEQNILIRDNVKLVINPDDACALGFALGLKKKHPAIFIEVVTMGPLSIRPMMEDILRRKVNRATILSDQSYVGSDTYATSRIIGKYLETADYDVILTGSHSLDGDTAHIPSQLAEYLKLNQMSYIRKIDEASFLNHRPLVDVDTEKYLDTYEMSFPSILSLCRESNYRLPFVRYDDLDLDVSDQLSIIGNDSLAVDIKTIGLTGSPTRVVKTYQLQYEKKDQVIVKNDDQGIDTIFAFLKKEGYL